MQVKSWTLTVRDFDGNERTITVWRGKQYTCGNADTTLQVIENCAKTWNAAYRITSDDYVVSVRENY